MNKPEPHPILEPSLVYIHTVSDTQWRSVIMNLYVLHNVKFIFKFHEIPDAREYLWIVPGSKPTNKMSLHRPAASLLT